MGLASVPGGAGYWMTTSDGSVFTFGTAPFFGSLSGRPLQSRVVGMAATPDGRGYWLVAADGGVFTFGDAPYLGSIGGRPPQRPGRGHRPDARTAAATGWPRPTVGCSPSATPPSSEPPRRPPRPADRRHGADLDGRGYWLAAADGGVFTFGDAGFTGSRAGVRGASPIVGLMPTGDGAGYWLVAADGGVFTFGDARFLGSAVGIPSNEPIVGISLPAGGF